MTDFNLFAELNEIDATELTDFTDTKSGGEGFAKRILPKGYALVRPVGYVEYGVQPQPTYQGKPKDPCAEFVLSFAIVGGQGLSTDNVKEAYVLEDGKFPIVSTYPTAIKLFDKAGAVKLHKALNNVGNQSTHIYQKLIESPLYLLKIDHVTPDKGKNAGKLKHVCDFNNLQPAIDPMTTEPYNAPQVDKSMIKCFLWDKPSLGQWDSIFIEGMYEAKEAKDGKEAMPARSKNYVQEKILSALNFEGSPLDKLLKEAGREVSMVKVVPKAETTLTPAVEAPVEMPATPAISAPTGDLD